MLGERKLYKVNKEPDHRQGDEFPQGLMVEETALQPQLRRGEVANSCLMFEVSRVEAPSTLPQEPWAITVPQLPGWFLWPGMKSSNVDGSITNTA